MQRETERLVLSLTYPHDIPLNQILFKCFFAPPVGSTTKRNINLTKEKRRAGSQVSDKQKTLPYA
jgi:hypothetical protein